MDFSSLISRVNKESFSDGKNGALRSYTGYFTGSQVVQVINSYHHGSDKVEALEIMKPRLAPLTGNDGKIIVEAFTFDKLKVVELIASHINDPANKYALLDAISFHFDREKARKILDEAKPTPAPCQQPGYYQQPPPGTYAPPPQQGYLPPQGGAPPPQQGYPPQQGGYPPPPQQPTGYPPPQPGYPPQPVAGYPPPQPGYPPAQPGYPPGQVPPPQPTLGGFQIGFDGGPNIRASFGFP